VRLKYLWYITAALFLVAGFRDLFLPGMLQISSRRSTPTEIVINFALGCFFGLFGLLNHVRRRSG
jgi:hypothetical protein